jgi:hypothetical protein
MVTHRCASRRLKLPLFQSPSTAVFSIQNWTCLALRPSADDDISGILPINIKYIISLTSDIHKYRVDQGYYIHKLIKNVYTFLYILPFY